MKWETGLKIDFVLRQMLEAVGGNALKMLNSRESWLKREIIQVHLKKCVWTTLQYSFNILKCNTWECPKCLLVLKTHFHVPGLNDKLHQLYHVIFGTRHWRYQVLTFWLIMFDNISESGHGVYKSMLSQVFLVIVFNLFVSRVCNSN